MRDMRLARHQFFSGLLLLITSLILAFFFFWPQYDQFKILQEQARQRDSAVPVWMGNLPRINPNQPDAWQKNVLNVLRQTGEENAALIIAVQGDAKNAATMEHFPASVRKVAVTITVNGSYHALQKFIKTVMTQWLVEVHSVTIRNVDKANLAPEESPVLEGIIQMDLFIQTL